MNKKIIYCGTPNISARVLRTLIENNFNIVGVITQPDKLIGRKKILTQSPVKLVCLEYNIPVFQFEKIRNEYEKLDIQADILLTCAYGQILPVGLLEKFEYALNIHASLLPKYRGGSPIQYAIYNNDKETGISLMDMVKEMDAGNVYVQNKVEISDNETTTSLFNKMAELASFMIVKYLPLICSGSIISYPQDPKLVTFAYNFDKSIEKIDLSKNLEQVYAQIRMLLDDIGGYLYFNDKKIKLWEVSIEKENHNKEIGKMEFRNKKIFVAVNGGYLVVTKLQLEGKKIINSIDFYNSNKNLIDTILR